MWTCESWSFCEIFRSGNRDLEIFIIFCANSEIWQICVTGELNWVPGAWCLVPGANNKFRAFEIEILKLFLNQKSNQVQSLGTPSILCRTHLIGGEMNVKSTVRPTRLRKLLYSYTIIRLDFYFHFQFASSIGHFGPMKRRSTCHSLSTQHSVFKWWGGWEKEKDKASGYKKGCVRRSHISTYFPIVLFCYYTEEFYAHSDAVNSVCIGQMSSSLLATGGRLKDEGKEQEGPSPQPLFTSTALNWMRASPKVYTSFYAVDMCFCCLLFFSCQNDATSYLLCA